MVKAIALIPARCGSKRVPDKNIRDIAGHPLLAYSIRAAIDSGVFAKVACATDSNLYAAIARHYGAEVPCLRPESTSGDKSPDIEWVEWILNFFASMNQRFEAFSILRPTNPFRTALTIQRAWQRFLSTPNIDSLRAVEQCKQHPGKMWVIRGKHMHPLLPLTQDGNPWHSSQYAALPPFYIQNGSLEIAWTRVVQENRTIAGEVICPFITIDDEGSDINDEFDWWKVQRKTEMNHSLLPVINLKAWKHEKSKD